MEGGGGVKLLADGRGGVTFGGRLGNGGASRAAGGGVKHRQLLGFCCIRIPITGVTESCQNAGLKLARIRKHFDKNPSMLDLLL